MAEEWIEQKNETKFLSILESFGLTNAPFRILDGKRFLYNHIEWTNSDNTYLSHVMAAFELW